MPFLLVIEGLDRTGKSTLAAEVADRMKSRVLHFSKPKVHPLNEYLYPLEDMDPDASLVFDRYHVGEVVWPEIWDRETPYDFAMHTYVEMVLRSRGAHMVRTLRDMDEIRAQLVAEDEPLSPGDAEHASELFDELFDASLLPHSTWELGQDPSPILQIAAEDGSHAGDVLRLTNGVIGDIFHPELLLVGDAIKPPGTQEVKLPFVPFPGTDGHFLMEELNTVPWLTDRVAVMNAYSRTYGPEPLREVYEAIGEPRVAALGATASATLAERSIPHTTIYHPKNVRHLDVPSGTYIENITRLIP